MVSPSFRPQVDRTGIAADPRASRLPVTVVNHPGGYVVIIHLPCRMRYMVGLGFGRTTENRGMLLDGRVGVGQSRGKGVAVRRPRARRVYSGGEFSMSFQFPVPVRTATLRRMDLNRSVLIFTLLKIPPNEPVYSHHSDYGTLRLTA